MQIFFLYKINQSSYSPSMPIVFQEQQGRVLPRWLFLNIPTWEEWRQAGARASVINSLFPIVSQYTGAALPHSECHWVISNDYQKVPIHTFLQNLSVWTLEELITTYIGLLYQVICLFLILGQIANQLFLSEFQNKKLISQYI